MDFPRYHKDIVGDLLDGKFLLASDSKFVELKNNEDFYQKFFKESFGYDLEMKTDYAYLISYETNEQLSRDMC
ncbi:MAG: condensin complex protein MksE, partial [Bacteroidota bacterium]